MGNIVQCEICDAHTPFLARALETIDAFYPDIGTRLTNGLVTLSSESRSGSMLRRIWLATLANERLMIDGQSPRDTVLRILIE